MCSYQEYFPRNYMKMHPLWLYWNKANLRDLIAATSREILKQIGFKSSIFQPMWPSHLMDDLKKNNRAHVLHYIKLCPSFQSHWWIQTGVTVRKHAIWVKSTFKILRPRQITAISQMTFSNAFSWVKMCEFRLGFHWGLFLRLELTIFQHWLR